MHMNQPFVAHFFEAKKSQWGKWVSKWMQEIVYSVYGVNRQNRACVRLNTTVQRHKKSAIRTHKIYDNTEHMGEKNDPSELHTNRNQNEK